MPNTTDIYGSSVEDDKLSRQLAVLSAVNQYKQEAAQAQTQAALPTKKLGRPGYVQTEKPAGQGREAQAFTRATELGKQLGSPESYGGQRPLQPQEITASKNLMASGQQEFAQPIAVTRGMTTTYQGPKYGQEYASSGQANQAFRSQQEPTDSNKYIPSGEGGGRGGAIAEYRIDKATKEENYRNAMNDILGHPSGKYIYRNPDGTAALDQKTGELQLNPILIPWRTRNKVVLESGKPEEIARITAEAETILKNHEERVKEKKLLADPNTERTARQNYASLNNNKLISAEEIKALKDSGFWPQFLKHYSSITVPPSQGLAQAGQQQAGQQDMVTPYNLYTRGMESPQSPTVQPKPLNPATTPIAPDSMVGRLGKFMRENPTPKEFTKTLFGQNYGPSDEYKRQWDEYYGRNR